MQDLLKPAHEREIGRILEQASATRTPVEVIGGGTKRQVGRPMQTAVTMTTATLSAITLYEPTEMVMSARAGTPLSIIEQNLASRGQMLAFEPTDLASFTGEPSSGATIGAVFAANLSGARRIQAGAARDHLLGVEAVSGRGELFKSGGRVMKNVTGYDLSRGLCGSWGTLAVMTQVTFKVQPVPEATMTLVLLGLPDDIAVELLASAMGLPYEISGAVHIQAPLVARLQHEGVRQQGRSVTALRLENVAKSTVYRAGRVIEALKVYGDIHDLDDGNSRAFWKELNAFSPFAGGDAPVWRISTAPLNGPKIVAAITRYMDCRAFYDWSGGLVFAEVLPAADAGSADIRRVVASHGGHATLMRGAPAVRAAIEVFQPLAPPVAAITRKLKASFDPAGILNPGRMYAET